jgi:hypothetical protein
LGKHSLYWPFSWPVLVHKGNGLRPSTFSGSRLLVDGIFVLPNHVFETVCTRFVDCLGPQRPPLLSSFLTGFPIEVSGPNLGPRAHLAVDRVTLQGTMANALRNLALHFGTPSDAINAKIEHIFRLAIREIGADPDDPSAVWLSGLEKFRVNHLSSNEMIAGAPLHLFLFVLSMGMVLYKRDDSVRSRALCYGLGIILAFLLFCALLRWQMASSRFHTALFVLGAALTGLVLERYWSPRLATGVLVVLLVFAALFALTNKTRSLVRWSQVEDVYHPRSVLYFADLHQKDAQTFASTANFVDSLDCKDIAIDAYTDDLALWHSPRSWYVYPLFPLIHADGRARRVWYAGVHNGSERYTEQFSILLRSP